MHSSVIYPVSANCPIGIPPPAGYEHWNGVVIRAANRVRLYMYGSWRAPRSPAGIAAALLPHAASQRHKHRGAARLRTFEGVEPMGRGRAKAKQVKVARQLKYNSGGTDLDRLRAELGVGSEQRDGDRDSRYSSYLDEDAADEDADEDEDEDDAWSES
jgi:Protein of unknown function (DUF3073)